MDLLTVEEAARISGLSKARIYKQVRSQEVTSIRVRSYIRIPREEVMRLAREAELEEMHLTQGDTVREAAGKLGVNEDFVRAMIRDGDIGAKKVGNQYLICPDHWRDFYSRNTTGGEGQGQGQEGYYKQLGAVPMLAMMYLILYLF